MLFNSKGFESRPKPKTKSTEDKPDSPIKNGKLTFILEICHPNHKVQIHF